MKLYRVNSTSIEAMGYDPVRNVARVLFQSPDSKTRRPLYEYRDVSPTLWEEIQSASSIGSAVQRLLVQPRRAHEKVILDLIDIQPGPMPDLTVDIFRMPLVTLRRYFDSLSESNAWC